MKTMAICEYLYTTFLRTVAMNMCIHLFGWKCKKTEFDGCKVFKVKVQRVRKLKEEDKEKSTKGAGLNIKGKG